MRQYKVGTEYYFREIGQKVPAGSVIELRPGDADRYRRSHPGLLMPLPENTMMKPQMVAAAKVEVQPDNPAEPLAPAEQPVPVTEAAPVEQEESKAEVPVEPAPAEVAAALAPAAEADSKPRAKSRAKKL